MHQEDVDEEDIQRDYAERLRAALSDVTDAKFENKRQTRQNTSSNIPYGRSRFAVKKRNQKSTCARMKNYGCKRLAVIMLFNVNVHRYLKIFFIHSPYICTTHQI